MAVPVLEAVLTQGRSWLPEGDPLVAAIRDVISPEQIEAGGARKGRRCRGCCRAAGNSTVLPSQ